MAFIFLILKEAMKDIKTVENLKDIAENIGKVIRNGDFCVEGEAFELPCCIGLEVQNFGPVSFPLTDATASELIKVIGLNKNTKGRKSQLKIEAAKTRFELKPDRVRIGNPEWEVKLNELAKRVADGLGCHGNIEVDKMTRYKEESFSETLIITLLKRQNWTK